MSGGFKKAVKPAPEFIVESVQAAETAIIGTLLEHPEFFGQASSLTPESFSFRPAAACFAAIRDFHLEDSPLRALNEITICTVDDVARLCTPQNILEWKKHAVSSEHAFSDFVEIIKGAAKDRKFNAILSDAMSAVQDGKSMNQVVSFISDAANQIDTEKARTSQKAGHFALQAITELANQNEASSNVITSGYDDLDMMISGFSGGQFIVVGARPAMGKTSFALSCATNACKNGKKVGVFSFEMGGKQLSLRVVSAESGVGVKKIKDRALNEEEWNKVLDATEAISELPLYLNDNQDLSFDDLLMDVTVRAKAGDLDMVLVDYLQLIEVEGAGHDRQKMISDISRRFKKLALKLDIPVIALSQLNRTLEQRVNKRPVMSDLRESGAIEQDADLIIFIYRDEVYNPETQDKGIAEIIIGKQRDGPTGTVRLGFDAETANFKNIRNVKGGIE